MNAAPTSTKREIEFASHPGNLLPRPRFRAAVFEDG
jgi:hypothetical protein